ncbi:MAG TPA: glycosyl transferase [Planctomycetaceae bacterium]|nr:glycosyl transferase [Planctomycetaceae bacterium]HRF01281.1 hypothetical protein [Pirellulaceae bacterium]
MWPTFRIELVAPPFAGHLFPALGAAARLKLRRDVQVTCATTSGGAAAVERAGIAYRELLPGNDARIRAIADPPRRVGSNPLRMLDQFRANLALMRQLIDELEATWSAAPPDLVIADFCVPFAGLTARRMGIPWWTGMPTPCALETRSGPPTYLGGWRPHDGPLWRVRDAAGRAFVSGFKRFVARAFRSSLVSLGIESGPYRDDGWELIYSNEKILGYAMREFEFERGWPDWFEFVGPISADPGRAGSEPEFVSGKQHCLISLGTHVPWAKRQAVELFRRVARLAPDWEFHFSWGDATRTEVRAEGNFRELPFVSYDRYLERYDAVVMHGGTGVGYACIGAGRPMLVWPQDYDQFDHAARLVHHGLARRLRPSPRRVIADLERIVGDPQAIESRERFREAHRRYDAPRTVEKEVESLMLRTGKLFGERRQGKSVDCVQMLRSKPRDD